MSIDFLMRTFQEKKNNDAIIWKDKVYTYHCLINRITYWNQVLHSEEIPLGCVTIIEADFSPDSVALMLA